MKLIVVNFDNLTIYCKFEWYTSESNQTDVNSNGSLSQSLHSNSLSRSKITFDQRSYLHIKPSLTGSYEIDEELHSVDAPRLKKAKSLNNSLSLKSQIIELVIRDYVDSWYKAQISSRDEFDQAVRALIYTSLRNLNKCLKALECEQFIVSVAAHSLIIHMRVMKKAREKMAKSTQQPAVGEALTNANFQKMYLNTIGRAHSYEKSLIETFFDLEAEMEKAFCRDCVSYNSKEIFDG